MNATALASLRARLAAENLTDGDSLQATLIRMVESPSDDDVSLRKLIAEAAEIADELELDDPIFFRGVAKLFSFANEIGVNWYDLAYANFEQTKIKKEITQ
jgi:hypothetical protein